MRKFPWNAAILAKIPNIFMRQECASLQAVLYGLIKKIGLLLLAFLCISALGQSSPVSPDAVAFAVQPLVPKQMLAEILIKHPSVLAALSQQAASQAEVQAAKWQYFPTPSISVEGGSEKLRNAADQRSRTFRLQQPLWTGGRLGAQRDRALAQEAEAISALQEVRLNLALRWLGLWADAHASQQRVEAFEESVQEHQRYVRQVENRAREGLATRSDGELSRTRLASVQAELFQARSQRQLAQIKLEQMWAAPWPASAALQFQSQLHPSPTGWQYAPDQILAQAVDAHPSLIRARLSIQTFEAEVDIARSRLSPEVYLRHDMLRGNVTGTQQQFVLGLTSSFGAGLSAASAVAAAQARVQSKKDEVLARQREITDQIQSEQVQMQSQRERETVLQTALSSAVLFLQSSERQFAAGRKTWQELMNSAREKAQLRAQLADTHAQAWMSSERLKLYFLGAQAYLATP